MKKAKPVAEEGVIYQKMYGGKFEVKFLGPTPEKPGRHIYMVNGVRKTGVTTYLGIKDKSTPLVIWAVDLFKQFMIEKHAGGITLEHIEEGARLHTVRKQEAADVGTEAHNWIEQFIKGTNPGIPENSKAVIAINGFLDWVKEHKVKFLSSERVVYSKKHDFIGKMDIEAKIDGELCLVDIKTSNGLYNDYAMQTAAYVKADEEESGREYAGRWLIRLSKETEEEYLQRMAKKGKTEFPPYVAFEARYLDAEAGNIERDYEAFVCCKKLYEWNSKTDFWKQDNRS